MKSLKAGGHIPRTAYLMDNHTYWQRVFRSQFVKEARALMDALERRVLPGFTDIEEESERISNQAYDAFMSSPGTGDEDPSEFAETATEIGMEHYMLLSGIRQGIVNLFAAALYHLFEQQLMLFHRRELLDMTEENDSSLFTLGEAKQRLRSCGVNITRFPSWPRVKELQLVANTIKHAGGKSAAALKKQRPDLFKQPGLPDLGEWLNSPRRVYQPLAGEDVYLSLDNLREYRDAVITFWEELADAMQAA
jgi:hypothetical protein